MKSAPVSIINNAEADRDWRWIESLVPNGHEYDWRIVSAKKRGLLETRIPFAHMGRIRAGFEVRKLVTDRTGDYLFSHGPHLAFYTALALIGVKNSPQHIAFSFNFTDLPGPALRQLMSRAFNRIDRFAVYSQMEIDLYSRVFGISADRFDFIRWSARPPIEVPDKRAIDAPYFVALGGEARDYPTLMQTAAMMPHTRFVFIMRPHNIANQSVPDNVTIFFNLDHQKAWSLVAHAEAALLPLRNAETPNGHVTLVGTMHLGKAQIVTASRGLADYVSHNKTAILVAPHSPEAFCEAITELERSPTLAQAIGANARIFVQDHCSEQNVIDYFCRIAR